MYPVELPLAEIRNVVAIMQAGEVVEKKANFAHDVWVIQGYAQSRIIGDPRIAVQASSEPTNPDAVALLAKVADNDPDVVSPQGLEDILSIVDWETILQWAVNILIEKLILIK